MKQKVLVVIITIFIGLFQLANSQPSNRAEVVPSGGGNSSGGGFTNFGVVGEPAVNTITGGTMVKKLGFIYKLGPELCPLTISPEEYFFNSAAHNNNTIAVTVGSGAGDCSWSASVDGGAAWVTIVPGTESGSGSGTIRYNVAQNNTGSVRTATITVTGAPNKTFTITQYDSLDIPTLPEWGLIALGAMLILGSGYLIKRSGLFS
jgi:hypothetical protein